LFFGPGQAVAGDQTRLELRVQRQEVLHVAARVPLLLARERAPQPVGELVALRQLRAEQLADEDLERGGAIAEEAGGDLWVEHPRGHGANSLGEDLEVLGRGVDDEEGVRALEEPRQRSNVD